MRASAPGKLFLFGEYAVLEGHPALIAAVDRRVIVEARPADRFVIESALFPEPLTFETLPQDGQAARVVAGIRAAHDLGASRAPRHLTIDSSALFSGGRKLGFGSSAAVAVAVAGAVLESKPEPRALFAACRQRHNEAQQTEGSGGDVAASIMGGLTWLAPGPELASLAWVPPLLVVAHPSSASTPAFVSSIKAYRAAAGVAYRAHIDALGTITHAARGAAEATDPVAFTECVRAANARLDALGRDAGAEICTPFHHQLAELARALGGAAKPAGAGGGDLSLIAAPSAQSLDEIRRELEQRAICVEALKVSPGLTIYGRPASLAT